MRHTEDWDIEEGKVHHRRALHASQDKLPIYAGHNGPTHDGTLRITFGDFHDALTIYITPEQARQIVAGLTSALD